MPDPTPEPITAADMGRMVGVTARQVRSLADRGHMVRQGDDRYDPAASLLAYCKFLRAAAQGRGGNHAAAAADEKARLSRARAELAEAKAGVYSGALVKTADVKAEWSGVLRTIRARMLAVPARVPNVEPATRRNIDAEIREALTELAETDDPVA